MFCDCVYFGEKLQNSKFFGHQVHGIFGLLSNHAGTNEKHTHSLTMKWKTLTHTHTRTFKAVHTDECVWYRKQISLIRCRQTGKEYIYIMFYVYTIWLKCGKRLSKYRFGSGTEQTQRRSHFVGISRCV